MTVARVLEPQEAIKAVDRDIPEALVADAVVALITRGEVQAGYDQDGELCLALTDAGWRARHAETGGLS